jgi:hypothetical protein
MAPNHMPIATNHVMLNWSITNISNVHKIPPMQHPPKWACSTKYELSAMSPKPMKVSHLMEKHFSNGGCKLGWFIFVKLIHHSLKVHTLMLTLLSIVISLEEKGQYVTITFTITCNYLAFATKFLLSTTIVTLC